MCGIFGFVSSNGRSPDPITLQKMGRVLIHRGPDSAGIHIAGNVGLGFRRLALVDLEGGQQPLLNEAGTIALACNGEIYNHHELRATLGQRGHTFATRSDVEVILHLYEEMGIDAVGNLNGQFAFALHDADTLILARDRAGVCPLFYAETADGVVFASEIKSLLQHPSVLRQVDVAGLDQILTFPGMVSPQTMFQGVRSLPPGHVAIVRAGQIQVRSYWNLTFHSDDGHPLEHWIDRLDEALTGAVERRLKADVDVGYYLSGGMDSSLIAIMAKRCNGNVRGQRTFSIAFDDNSLSEAPYQQAMARVLRAEHREIGFSDQDLAELLAEAVYHSESPLKESYNAASFKLARTVRESGLKTVLSGEGADELFAGYVGYRLDAMGRSRIPSVGSRVRDVNTTEEEIRQRLWGDTSFLYERQYAAHFEQMDRLLSPRAAEARGPRRYDNLVDKAALAGYDTLQRRSYIDFKLRLADHLVSDHGDRMGMANSVELRYPFLDNAVLDVCQAMPSAYKLRQSIEKFIVRKVAERYLPPAIVNREKFAFVGQTGQALLRLNLGWCNDLLSYEQIKREGYFNPEVVEALRLKYQAPEFCFRAPFEEDLLLLVLTFGLFRSLFDMPCL